jgi:site-specific DNA recombinase
VEPVPLQEEPADWYKKNPQTGRRFARPNSREKWGVAEVLHLRIVDDALWNRVKARQEDMRIEMARDADGNALNRPHRWQFLLSGLIECGGAYPCAFISTRYLMAS